MLFIANPQRTATYIAVLHDAMMSIIATTTSSYLLYLVFFLSPTTTLLFISFPRAKLTPPPQALLSMNIYMCDTRNKYRRQEPGGEMEDMDGMNPADDGWFCCRKRQHRIGIIALRVQPLWLEITKVRQIYYTLPEYIIPQEYF